MNPHFVSAKPRRRTTRQAFTLTEVAIVLGIIGLILGAIWTAATLVYGDQRVDKAATEIITIANGARAILSVGDTTGLADGGDMTYLLCDTRVLPDDTIPPGGCGSPGSPATMVDPWQGALTVSSTSISAPAAGNAISIRMTGIPAAACTALMVRAGGGVRDPGLLFIGASGAYAIPQPAGTAAAGGAFPVTPASAGSATQCGGGAIDTLTMVFALRV